jgi:hypothetical protein
MTSMMRVRALAWVVPLALVAAAAGASQARAAASGNRAASTPACDRACLSALMSDYLSALAAGNASTLPLNRPVRFTEDQQERRFGVEGIWKQHVALTGYRFDILDVRAGIAASLVKVRIDGMPALLALRLVTRGGRICGVESIVVHSRTEGMLFNVGAIRTVSHATAVTPARVQRDSRQQMIAIASRYPRGLQLGSFVKADVPFAADAYRFENGMLMAGPHCTFLPGCEHIRTQHIPTLAKLVYRIAAVDEQQGVVLIRMDFGPGSVFPAPGRAANLSLSVFEAFKVYGHQIHAVEAFMKIKPADQPLGWN